MTSVPMAGSVVVGGEKLRNRREGWTPNGGDAARLRARQPDRACAVTPTVFRTVSPEDIEVFVACPTGQPISAVEG